MEIYQIGFIKPIQPAWPVAPSTALMCSCVTGFGSSFMILWCFWWWRLWNASQATSSGKRVYQLALLAIDWSIQGVRWLGGLVARPPGIHLVPPQLLKGLVNCSRLVWEETKKKWLGSGWLALGLAWWEKKSVAVGLPHLKNEMVRRYTFLCRWLYKVMGPLILPLHMGWRPSYLKQFKMISIS